MQVKVMTLKEGHEFKIRVKPKDDCDRFYINIGHDSENYALHFNPRFDQNCIVFNSKSAGCWGEEQQIGNFPFTRGEECEIYINFNNEQFYIKLPDGHMTNFPNRPGEFNYKYLDIGGDVTVIGIMVE